MIYVLYGLFLLVCFVLVVAVLLQPGKADAGALFTSSVSSTAFGPRGTQTLLAKITIGAAALFMLGALVLSLPGITSTRSVVEAEPDASPVTSPQQTASPASSPQENATPATSNTNSQNNTGEAPPQSSPAAQNSPAANANDSR